MELQPRTTIVTGAWRGIGAGVTNAFLERGYNVVANSLRITQSDLDSKSLALAEGDVAEPSTAAHRVVNNAGIFFIKPFTEYTSRERHHRHFSLAGCVLDLLWTGRSGSPRRTRRAIGQAKGMMKCLSCRGVLHH